MVIGMICFLMAIGSMLRPRWLPQKSFPPYAYLPGREPHPVRDPTGHSYHVEPIPVAAEASLGSDVFLWGLDLFNHGYYWEAHEAWEGLWQVADRDGPLRMLFKGLILFVGSGGQDSRAQTCGGCNSCQTRRGSASRLLPRVQTLTPSSVTGGQDSLSSSPSELQPSSKSKPDGLTAQNETSTRSFYRAMFALLENVERDVDDHVLLPAGRSLFAPSPGRVRRCF